MFWHGLWLELAWIKLLGIKAIHDKVKRTTRGRRLVIRKASVGDGDLEDVTES